MCGVRSVVRGVVRGVVRVCMCVCVCGDKMYRISHLGVFSPIFCCIWNSLNISLHDCMSMRDCLSVARGECVCVHDTKDVCMYEDEAKTMEPSCMCMYACLCVVRGVNLLRIARAKISRYVFWCYHLPSCSCSNK